MLFISGLVLCRGKWEAFVGTVINLQVVLWAQLLTFRFFEKMLGVFVLTEEL
jgi:hypothetical protein